MVVVVVVVVSTINICIVGLSLPSARRCGFAAVGPASRRCRSLAARPALSSSRGCGQCHVVS